MGIPSGGIIIRPPNTTDMQLVKDHVAHILSSNFTRKTLTFSRARQVLSNLHNTDTISKEKEPAFQIAFVLYAVGSFLAPWAGPSTASMEAAAIWAVADPKRASKCDRALYTMEHLVYSARAFKSRLHAGPGSAYLDISGCTLFLFVCTLITNHPPASLIFLHFYTKIQ